MKKQTPYSVVFADEHILVVNKSAGLSVLPGRGRNENLFGMLKVDPALNAFPVLPVHRIDADTSGLLLIARNADAQKNLQEQFRTRVVAKEYWAIVRGSPPHESGSVDMPVGADPRDKLRMTVRGDQPRDARTKWTMLERFRGISLLAVQPVTGRRHQIRVHLKAMGYPLAVDPLYGGESLMLSEFKRGYKTGKDQIERPLIGRLTLHARSLVVAHPATGIQTTFQIDPPRDFAAALTALRRWAGA